ncbi:hypothetical protein BFP97_05495 [Roseivirga sp. 4D4]|uniref:cyclic nucleotide-binding domain-containing protein n=1 Tax=Roseivirga sp. 4D4 TaxID=1889784 RepID=UPI0008533088|nr:cyclic nucleotide-binding domain-containing protein [Roseivirga sp. 4D4]OEK00997.1 hypothetical protein BFP97_05495 [Roseivirga sp. 4D4]
MILTYKPEPESPRGEVSDKVKDKEIRIVKKFSGGLYREGERLNKLFFLIDGKVSLFKRNGYGQEVKILTIGQGGFLGVEAFQGNHILDHTAKVIRAAKLLVIPLVRLPEVMTRWPKLKHQVTLQLIGQLDLLEDI